MVGLPDTTARKVATRCRRLVPLARRLLCVRRETKVHLSVLVILRLKLFWASTREPEGHVETGMNVRTATPPNAIRVAIVDDHPLFREGIVEALAGADGIEIVGEGATATDALAVARERAPDIMLLDLRLPGGGISAAANIACACPKVRIVALTASEDEEDVVSALRAGIRGYILKGSTGDEVIETVRAIFQGGSYVAPTLAGPLLIKAGNRTNTLVTDAQCDLTACEEKVFALVAQGMSNKEAARSLKCSERTIKHHMTNIMQKLNVRNRVQAALKFRPVGTAA
jgi:two-component system, NarL family, nitrate/nitrite response regulator NarL